MTVLLTLPLLLILLPEETLAQAPPESTPGSPVCGTLGIIATDAVVDPAQFCPEYLVPELAHSDMPAIASIAYAPACTDSLSASLWCERLFFTRPDQGLLQWVGEFDPETLTYSLRTFASGLNTPTGLAWFDGAWFVLDSQFVYRLEDRDGDGQSDRRTIITRDLPPSQGAWSGSLNIGPDDRLYFTQGASCEACIESDPRRASLLSLNTDGTDLQVVASGLHNAFDFGWHPVSGDLWISESGPTIWGETRPLDELNHLTEPHQHFGWPFCFEGPEGPFQNTTLQAQDSNFCAGTEPPDITFPAHSGPAGLMWYWSDAFSELKGDLLLVTSGSWNRRLPTGYALYRICFDPEGNIEACTSEDGESIHDSQGQPVSVQNLIPVDPYYRDHGLETMHVTGQSFYPDHPVDVAVSHEGRIAIAVMEGQIIQIRPAPSE